jgi:hypothetical protein
MRQGEKAAGQCGYGQQPNYAHEREANRQRRDELDVAASNASALVNDEKQQEQDGCGDQRFGNVSWTGKLTNDPEQRQHQTNLISNRSCRDIHYCNVYQQQYFQK